MKYIDWLEQWVNNYIKPTVKQRTFEHYEDIVHRQIVPRLGEFELEALLPSVLQKFTVELCGRYAVNTVSGIISCLKIL